MNFSQYAFGITKNSILEYFSGPITKHFSLDKESFDEFIWKVVSNQCVCLLPSFDFAI